MRLKVIAAALVLLLAAAAQAVAEEKVYRASVDSDGVQRVEIEGGEYYFTPRHIVVKVNVPVELTVRKTPGITPHNIVIHAPEAGIDFDEDMGTDGKKITFTPAKTGKFSMYCSKRFLFFKSHREKGMEGVLEVAE